MTYSQADITVPYAVANFAEIRHKGYYYVDKTNYIPLLERSRIYLVELGLANTRQTSTTNIS